MEIKRILTYSFFKGCSIIFLNWSIADLQCLLISAIQQVTQLYTYVLFFLYYFPLWFILEIGYSSLCHTVGLCCLSILLFLAELHGIQSFLHQGWNLYPLPLERAVLTTGPPGKSFNFIIYRPLYSQQKQDQELTVAQTMDSLLPDSDLNWRK